MALPDFIPDDEIDRYSSAPDFISDADLQNYEQPPEDPGFLDVAGRGLASGFFGIGRAAGSGIEALGDLTGIDAVSDFGEDTRRRGENIESILRGNDIEPGSLDSIVYNTVSGLTQAVPVLAGGIATLGAGAALPVAATLGGMTGVEKYTELTDRGIDGGTAALSGAGVGALDTALNAVPLGYYLKAGVTPLKRAAVGALLDGTSSAISTAGNIGITKATTGDEFDSGDLTQIGESAASSLLSGPAMAAIGGGRDSIARRRAESEAARIMQELEASRPQELLGLPAPEGVTYGDNFTMRESDPTQGLREPPDQKRGTPYNEPVILPQGKPQADPYALPQPKPEPEPLIVQDGYKTKSAEDVETTRALLAYLKRQGIASPEGVEAPRDPLAPTPEIVKPFTARGTVREALTPEEKKIAQYLTSEKIPLEDIPAPPQEPQPDAVPVAPEVETAGKLADIPAPPQLPEETQGSLFGAPERTQSSKVDNNPLFRDEVLPVKDIRLSKDVPQWKSNADEKGIVAPLQGEFDDRGVAPIIVWERLDGSKEVISGRHRLDLAQRSGRATIRTQVVREADGFSAKDAAVLDAEMNIRDEHGEISDYANYFNSSGIDEETARSRGLLSRNKGVLGYDIGSKATPDLYTLYQNGKLTDRQAAAIAKAAPGNDSLQQVAIKSVLAGNPIDVAVNQVKVLEADFGNLPASEQGSLFGSDDRAIKLAEAQAKVASQMQRDIIERVRSAQGAAKRPDLAKKLGVDVNDPESVKSKIAELQAQQERLDRWYNDPELKAQIAAQATSSLNGGRKGLKDRFNSERGRVRNPFYKDPSETGSDIPVAGLTKAQKFFEGRLGDVKIPGLGAWRRNMTLDKTIADKFPQAKQAYYEGGRKLQEHSNEVAYDLAETFRPYFNLKDTSRLDAVLSKLREDAISSKKKGKPILNPTDADLQKAGLSPEEIEGYKAYRKGTDKSLDVLREALLEDVAQVQGAENQKRFREDVDFYINSMRGTNYTPFRRYGDAFEVVVKEKTGDQEFTTWRSHHDSKAEARKAAAELRKQGKEAVISQRPQFDQDAYRDLPADLLQNIQEFHPDKWTKLAEDRPMQGFNRHLVRAEGIEGYDKNIRKATTDYVLGLAQFAGRKKALPIIDKVIKGVDAESNPALKGHLERYKERLTSPTSEWANNARRTANVINLAGVPASAIVNGTQTATTTLPKIIGETSKRVGTRRATIEAPKIMARSMADAFTYLGDKVSGKQSLAKKNPELAKDLETAMKRGIIDAEGMNELFALKKKIDGKSGFNDKMMFMFGAAEKGNRLFAFISGREVGKRNGLKGDELFNYARKFVLDTQFDISKANQNAVVGSDLGGVVTQYKLFPANYLRFLRNHTGKGDRLTLALSLGVTAGLGGAMALPFAKQIESLAEAFGFNARLAWKKFTKDADWAHATLYGLPTYLGTNLSGFMSTGEFIPNVDMDPKMAALQAVGGPLVGYAGRLAKGYKAYTEDDNPEVALETVVPRFARGPLKDIRIARDKDNDLKDVEGKPLIKNVTPWEKVQIGAGLSPDRLGRAYEEKAFEYDIKEKANHRPKDYNMLLARSLKAGDIEAFKGYVKEMGSQGFKPDKDTIKKHIAGAIDPRLEALMEVKGKTPSRIRATKEMLEMQQSIKRR